MSLENRRTIAGHWPLISGGVAVGIAGLLGILVALRESPIELDAEWMEELLEGRRPWWDVPALFMDWLGGGLVAVIVVPLLIAGALVLARRPLGAAVFLLASVLSAGLVVSDEGSFPSGHVANAATIAIALGLILALDRGRRWVWMLGALYIVAMALSRTYLGVHWLTDTIGGALLGAGVAVIVWVPFARALAREPRPRRVRS